MPLEDSIRAIIDGQVTSDEAVLTSYSTDASIFEIKPQLVVYPKDSQDIQKLVKFAQRSKEKVSLTARSAGTDMSGGAVNDSIILDLTRHFNKILKVGLSYAVTQPGVFYRDFEKETLKHNLILPSYPASREICTVGGMVGNNSAGEKTLSFGQTENYVQRLKVVLTDGNEYIFEPLSKKGLDKKIAQKNFEGEIYQKMHKLIETNFDLIQSAKPKVSKNSAGYALWSIWDGKTFDLTKLIVGSQGTLGIVTEIEFRLVPPHKYSKLLVIFLYNIGHLGEVVEKILSSKPESFESYDDKTFEFGLRFWPEVVKVIRPKNIFSLGLSFIPEAWMVLKHGPAKLVLMAEFTGDDESSVIQKCLEAQQSIKKYHLLSRITTNEDDANKYWALRRESFNLFRHHSGDKRTAPFIDDIIVAPQHLAEFLPKLQKILKPYQELMVYTIAGHIGNGNFHIIPMVDLKDPKVRAIIPKLADEVYNLVFQYQGSMAAEHNDGLIRGPFLKKMYGDKIYTLFKETKSIFDPKNIFNPHKKIDATFEYLLTHISNS